MNESGKNWLLAIGGIIVIVTVYEISPRIGVGLFIIALLGMTYNFARRPDFINPKRY